MTSRKPRFVDPLSWDATVEERWVLSNVRETLTGFRRAVASAAAAEVQAFAVAARVARAQMERSGSDSEFAFPWRAVAAELAVALRVPVGEVEARMADAELLEARLPQVRAALSAGRITRKHADVIREVAQGLPDAVLGEFLRRVVGFAEEATPRQLRVFASELAGVLHPVPVAEGQAAVREKRGTWTRALPGGLGEFVMRDEASVIAAVADRLDQMARLVEADERRADREAQDAARDARDAADAAVGVTRDGLGFRVDREGNRIDQGAVRVPGGAPDPVVSAVDPERVVRDAGLFSGRCAPGEREGAREAERVRVTRTQRRADLAGNLLLTGAPTGYPIDGDPERLAGVRGTVTVTVPVTSLVGLDDGPAMLAGYGPVPAETARRLARYAPGWERIFQNPDTGALLTVDHYQPTAAIRRLVELRDECCRFPGCSRPAPGCEKDHVREYSRGGPTNAENLEALCRPHHYLRHHTRWSPRALEDGGIEWTSPLGHVYVTEPEPRRRHHAIHDPQPPPEPPPF
ncbi:HNH endonuclease signature motif containing protein [Microbacterium sp. JZ37]|uniref:HNH endonuclease signature motif containing protein n=1 Tax=Microbacterium sp. JZ37 TaxID=2654193 RepID=UPI002B4A2275|nr:DUF222 domain-containing protein [Microbacterium sp. JZ37]